MNMIGENLSQKETQFGYMLLLLIASGWKCHELPMYHSSLMMMPHLRAHDSSQYSTPGSTTLQTGRFHEIVGSCCLILPQCVLFVILL